MRVVQSLPKHTTLMPLFCQSVRAGGHHWGTNNGDIVGRGLFRSSLAPCVQPDPWCHPAYSRIRGVTLRTAGSVVSPCVQPDPWCHPAYSRIRGVTPAYSRIHSVTPAYSRIRGVTHVYSRIDGVTPAYSRIRGVTLRTAGSVVSPQRTTGSVMSLPLSSSFSLLSC